MDSALRNIPPAVAAKLAELPARPGVYVHRDAGGRAIYIGKAKSLRQRVRSYFQPGVRHEPRIERMLAEVAALDVIVVDSEIEALILESNLVKRERPRFNVLLRDDKQFPYLRLSLRDEYPRVGLVRRAQLDGDAYFGPFLPASGARRTMKLVQQQFQVATCNEVFDGQRRPCLYWHLDQCLAPCAGKTDPQSYARAVADARLFLEGRHRDLAETLERRMHEAAAGEQFERAARLRDTLVTVRQLAQRQRMASVGLEEQDYWAHHAVGLEAALQVFQMREGRIQGRREFTFAELDLDPAAFYASVITQYYADLAPPPEIYLPLQPEGAALLERWLGVRRGGRVRLRVPERGAKRRLLELVRRNAELGFEARFRSLHAHGVAALESLAALVGMDEPPRRIECFDVSNIQGADSVAALVVWLDGRPARSEYRTFHIRGVRGPDDFASIAEAVTRRYRRLLAEERPLPDLVLIDGGAGQLGAAVSALARVGLPMLHVAALAKREEELYLEGRGGPVRAPRDSPGLQLLQRIRDEAHRFAVTRHRKRRARRTLRTELTEIHGVGPRTASRLLRAFGSVAGVRAASPEALREVAGARAASAVEEWKARR